jgi:hypothetical protein
MGKKEVDEMIRTSMLARKVSIGRQLWSALGLSILCCAAQWPLAVAVSAQDELCGNGSIDFGEGETCDDGGTCEGGDNDGLKGCTSLNRCESGVNQGDVCTSEEECPPLPGDTSCPSDCDANGRVDVSELVVTLDIALGRQSIDVCLAADSEDDGAVTIDDAVLGVNSVLSGCPQRCREFCPGGTCVPQDGDLDVDDDCPANCRINDICMDPTPFDVTVGFSAPGDGQLSTGRFFLRYSDQSLRLPGSGAPPDNSMILDRFSFPWLGTVTPNDLDYAVRVLALADVFFAIEPDELFTITFDRCGGTPDPTAADFRCTVFDAFAVDASDVTDQTTCSVQLP